MQITNLAAALVKAQAKMDGALKDSANPFFKSKYADLSSVVSAIKPVAAEFGLGYIQVSHNVDNHAAIETVIVHESGESFSCGVVSVPVAKVDAQGFGSAMTYARRYSLSAAFGVCPEDDDGNAAAKAPPKAVSPISAAAIKRDAFDELTPDLQRDFMAKVDMVRAQLDAGNQDGGYDIYAEFRDSLDDAAHKAALRGLFSSAEQSILTKQFNKRKEKEAA